MKKKRNECFPFSKEDTSDFLRVMKLIVFSLLVAIIHVSANGYSETANIDINVKTSDLSKVMADNKIKGRVLSEDGNPIPGATVVVKGTTIGAITDFEGNYSLSKISDNAVLVFSFVGMKTIEIQFSGQKTLNVTMSEETTGIDEVVVVGYGVQKKASVTGSISTVGATDLVKAPVGSLGTAMTGRLTGMTTVQRSGQPGNEFPTITIRGNSNPLVIVDGVERSSGGLRGYSDGTEGAVSGWESINPNDVESISILKDASATAVYGVRGANGVIIITTKQGFSGKPEISYNGNFGLSTPVRLRHNIGSYDYGLYANEGYYNDGQSAYMPYDDMNRYRYNYNDELYPSVDFADAVLKKFSTKQSHNLSLRGGTKKVKYFSSVGYYDETGLMKQNDAYGFDPNQHYKRMNMRVNMDINFTKHFSASLNIDGRVETRHGPNAPSDSHFFWKLYQAHPWVSPGFDEEGRYIVTHVEANPSIVQWILGGGIYEGTQTTGNTVFSLKHDLDFITKGLSVNTKYSFDSFVDTWYQRTKSYASYQPIEVDGTVYLRKSGTDGPFGYTPQGSDKRRKEYFDVSFNYARTFGDHAVTGLALYNQEKSRYYYSSFGDVPHAYLGFVGRATYSYKNRYFAEFNIGINGSENFPKGQRFGVFPAYSAGWLVTDEPFMKNFNTLSYLKIRGSYGKVGSDVGISRFLYLPTTYSNYPAAYYQLYGEPTTSSGQIRAIQEGVSPNYDVSWETTTKYNIGFDSKFFADKLSLSFDYFNEDRDDILTMMADIPSFQSLSILSPSGFATTSYQTESNYGQTESHGIEVELGWRDKIGKDFSYNVKGTYAYAIKKYKRLSEVPQTYPWQYSEGHQTGEYSGLICDGYWNSYAEINDPNVPFNTYDPNPIPGDLKYKDINGDMRIDNNDYQRLGDSNTPRSTFTASLGFTYKRFEVSALFQGATNVLYQPSEESQIMMNEGSGAFGWISDRWTPETRTGDYPVLHATNNRVELNYVGSSYWAFDASYVRLKNLEIGYNLPKEWFGRLNIDQFKFFVSGQNLWTYTPCSQMDHFDPEMIQGRLIYYPIMEIFNMGLSIIF